MKEVVDRLWAERSKVDARARKYSKNKKRFKAAYNYWLGVSSGYSYAISILEGCMEDRNKRAIESAGAFKQAVENLGG